MSIVLPNAAPPGSLADFVVGAGVWRRLRRAQGIEIVTFTQGWKEHVTRIPVDDIPAIAERLVQLLRDDRLYTGMPRDPEAMGSKSVELRLSDPLPNTRLALYLKNHAIHFSYDDERTFVGTDLLLDPVAKPLLELIKQNAPTDERVKRLTFTPLPVKLAPVPVGIPAATLRILRSVRPGMRRADILRLLKPDGGFHGRLERQFFYPRAIDKKGQIAKVTVRFVPANTHIRWIDGVGYPIGMKPAHTLSVDDAHNTDIVISVSEPFVGYSITR